MKLGVFADIHGNGRAFDAVIRALESEKCDAWIFLGDICGYYYDQKEIIDAFCDFPHLKAVLGNHDSLFLKSLNDPEEARRYSRHYGRSVDYLKESITPEQIIYLKTLPETLRLDDSGILACHGSPRDPLNEYVFPDADFAQFEDCSEQFVLLGHTHRPMDIQRKTLRIINPGSAGQPRDGGRASFALLETETGRLEIKYVDFDIPSLIKDIRRRGETNTYLIEVLLRIEEPA